MYTPLSTVCHVFGRHHADISENSIKIHYVLVMDKYFIHVALQLGSVSFSSINPRTSPRYHATAIVLTFIIHIVFVNDYRLSEILTLPAHFRLYFVDQI